MGFIIRAAVSAKESDRPDFKQIFGAQSPLRGRAFLAIILAAILGVVLVISQAVSVVLKSEGPGLSVSQRDSQSPADLPPLFDFSDVTDIPAPLDAQATYLHSDAGIAGCLPEAPGATRPFEQVYAFVPMRIDWLNASIKAGCPSIDVAMPDWFELGSDGVIWSSKYNDPKVYFDSDFALLHSNIDIVPVASISPHWIAPTTGLAESELLMSVSTDLKNLLQDQDLQGLCLNISDQTPANLIGRLPILEQVVRTLHSLGAQSCLVVGPGQIETINSPILDDVSFAVLLGFTKDWTGRSGLSLSDSRVVGQAISHAAARVGLERLVVMLPSGGISRQSGKTGFETVDYATAMAAIRQVNGSTAYDPGINATYASLIDAHGQRQQFWLQDAVSTFNYLVQLKELGVRNTGIWGLGLEDPSLWPLFVAPSLLVADVADDLRAVDLADLVRYEGAGPILTVKIDGTTGLRSITANETGTQVAQSHYSSLPTPFVITKGAKPEPKRLILTFDDGPDTDYTPAILDILKREGVPATFFMTGTNMIGRDEIVRRVYDEGHLIGTHLFTHSEIGGLSASRFSAELKVEDRLFTVATGHRPVLFRPPYLSSKGPDTGAMARRLRQAQDLGYISMNSDVISWDWTLKSAEQIEKVVVDSVLDGHGNVILLHDGGGDRSATVAALPGIIAKLRDLGYEFGDISAAIGHDKAVLMPAESPELSEKVVVRVASFVTEYVKEFMIVVIVLGLARSLVMIVGAICRGRKETWSLAYHPEVTVIVPAYNEEKVIVRTIQSILSSSYSNISVIAVNDGSKDQTEAVLLEAFSDDPRVQIVSQRNQGKWRAANEALRHVKTEIVVAIDADTLVDPEAIKFLVRRFTNPAVGAVAGNVKVGNTRNILTRIQAIEYITAQNIERRTFELGNGIMVVPGAIGAWRVDAVRKAGGYSRDTLTEDADLTVAVLRAGYKIEFEERAYTYTEAPETVGALLSQRLRWTLGMMQVAWKHRGAMREWRTVGLWTLPDLVLFGVLIPLMVPLIDLALIYAVVTFVLDFAEGRSVQDNPIPPVVMASYFLLPLVEMTKSAVAFHLDPRARFSLLLYMPLQHVIYRVLMTLTLYRAVWRALSGHLANWSKLQRTASVTAQFAEAEPVRSARVGLRPIA